MGATMIAPPPQSRRHYNGGLMKLLLGLVAAIWGVTVVLLILVVAIFGDSHQVVVLPSPSARMKEAEPLITVMPATITPELTITAVPSSILTSTATPTIYMIPTMIAHPTLLWTVALTEVPQADTPISYSVSGTLHRATIAEWRQADLNNRISTIRDWTAAGFNLKTLDAVMAQSVPVFDCVNASLDGYARAYSELTPVVDMAVICMMIIKGQTPLYPPAPTSLWPSVSSPETTPTLAPATETPRPTLIASPTLPMPSPTSESFVPPCACYADLYVCKNFSTGGAQACFEYCVAQGAGDIHGLDRDRDNLACEE